MEGFLLVNKPAGITSSGCVLLIKRLVGKGVKIGHAGTLDKFATGLLIVGIGRSATKHLGLLLNLSKSYVAMGKLGELTDTYDPDGTIVESCSESVTQQTLQLALKSFGNSYIQVPPVYSALKFKGERLSDLKRSAQDLAAAWNVDQLAVAKSRNIFLYRLVLVSFNYPYFKIETHVSSGTYIRSLVNDLARRSKSCATTVQLERTAIGPFKLVNAMDLQNLDLNQINQNLIPVPNLLKEID